MIAVLATPALGAVQKVGLVPCSTDLPVGCALNDEPSGGGGFVIFNDRDASAGAVNLLVTVSLKGVKPDTAYDVYLFVDQINVGVKLGTVTTNGVGNAVFVGGSPVGVPGAHDLAVDVTRAGSSNDVYLSSGLYSSPDMSATLTFK
jgi:hypothetical protein